jgi:hypothetical protein
LASPETTQSACFARSERQIGSAGAFSGILLAGAVEPEKDRRDVADDSFLCNSAMSTGSKPAGMRKLGIGHQAIYAVDEEVGLRAHSLIR